MSRFYPGLHVRDGLDLFAVRTYLHDVVREWVDNPVLVRVKAIQVEDAKELRTHWALGAFQCDHNDTVLLCKLRDIDRPTLPDIGRVCLTRSLSTIVEAYLDVGQGLLREPRRCGRHCLKEVELVFEIHDNRHAKEIKRRKQKSGLWIRGEMSGWHLKFHWSCVHGGQHKVSNRDDRNRNLQTAYILRLFLLALIGTL